MKDKKRKEIKEDNYGVDLEMSANIPLEGICPECGHQIIGGNSYICSNCGYRHFSTFSNIVL